MLDAIGLTKRRCDGYRCAPTTAQRLIIELPTIPAFIQFTQLGELVKVTIGPKIGIFANVVEQDRHAGPAAPAGE